jgi:hypothetical protein
MKIAAWRKIKAARKAKILAYCQWRISAFNRRGHVSLA